MNGSVLVVDDSPEASDSLTAVLEAAGYHVAQACQGKQALSYLRARSLPAVILLDLHMPVMNGRDFRKAQLEDPRLAKIPVILLSGEGDLRVHAQELGVAAFITKPVEIAQLLDYVQLCLEPDGTPAPEQPAGTGTL